MSEFRGHLVRQTARPGRIIANKLFWFGYYSVKLPLIKGLPPFAEKLRDDIRELEAKHGHKSDFAILMSPAQKLIYDKYLAGRFFSRDTQIRCAN